MKKIFLVLYISTMVSVNTLAQNLVPNPSFEDTVSCPNLASQIDRAAGWSSYRISPDYYNICDTNPSFGVPSNIYGGYQQPHTGVAYTGLYGFAVNVFFHEIMGVQLLQPLTTGQTYYCSFYVSRGCGVGFYSSANVACNKLGMRFLNQPYYFLTNPIPIDDHVHVVTNSIITDTLNWTLISGCFTADSAYEYLAIGIFNTDININYISYTSSPDAAAYYYVDDVFVGIDSSLCSSVGINNFNSQEISSFKIFPNPFEKEIFIFSELTEGNVEIVDQTGRILIRQNLLKGYNKINTQFLATGVYNLIIYSEQTISKQKLIKIHK